MQEILSEMKEEIRNPDKKLVCCIDEATGRVEILLKNWMTVIQFNHDGTKEISHYLKSAT